MHSLSICSVCGLFGYTITLPTPPPPSLWNSYHLLSSLPDPFFLDSGLLCVTTYQKLWKTTVPFPTSLPGSLSYQPREPGWVWSCVSQHLGDYKQTIWGRGGLDLVWDLSLQNVDAKCSHQTVSDLVLKVMTNQDILNAKNNAQNPLTAKA